jgi:hypothetical protein
MKAAACGTWLGDLITALIVTDIMLQDNLYPGWAPNLRFAICFRTRKDPRKFPAENFIQILGTPKLARLRVCKKDVKKFR